MELAYRVKEHFWTKESFVAHVDVHHVTSQSLMDKLFKLAGLDHFALIVHLFFVKGSKFFQDVLADVAVLLFYLGGDLV